MRKTNLLTIMIIIVLLVVNIFQLVRYNNLYTEYSEIYALYETMYYENMYLKYSTVTYADDDKYYHLGNCILNKSEYIEFIELIEAEKIGLQPCPVCFPEE